MTAPTDAILKTVEAVWRIEAPRLIGGLMRMVRDLDAAEDLAQDALVAALATWPSGGVPDNPGAWLMTTAKRRALDRLRRQSTRSKAEDAILHALDDGHAPDLIARVDTALDDRVADDVLRLILVACHPVLGTDARAALTLRLVAGLTTVEIARAFLTTEATIAQRIVRAKRTIAEARVPFEVPHGPALVERTQSALEVIYLIYNEGYAATRGDDVLRPALCDEALRVGRQLAALTPDDAEVHGLLALMELQSSRQRARVDRDGAPVLLTDQDRSTWDRLQIARGLRALERAERLCAAHGSALEPYALQASIAACHARAPHIDQTDWHRIVALYDALAALTGSPVVELNRAVAIAMADGPAEGLALVDQLENEPALHGYHLLASVRGDLLARLGRNDEAAAELTRAATLTQNEREKAALLLRATTLAFKVSQ